MNDVICQTCVEVHGRDTNAPIQCPHCNKIVGCFWHNKAFRHIKTCLGVNQLRTQKTVWDKDRFK